MAQNDALSRLNSMMSSTRFPKMQVSHGGDFASDFANGYNMIGTFMDDIRARNDRKRLKGLLENYLGGGEKTANDLYNQYQYGDNEATLNGIQQALQQQAQQGGGQQPFNGFSLGQQATDTYSPLQQAQQNNNQFSFGESLPNAQYAPSGQQVQTGQTFAPAFNNILGLGTERDSSPYQPVQQEQGGLTTQVVQNNSPFVGSANDEGQRIADLMNIRPTMSRQEQQRSPQYLPMKDFFSQALASGMLPSNAMGAYNAFVAPMEEEARKRRIGENFAKLANRYNMSPEELTNIRAQLSQDLYKDYGLEDMGAMTDLLSKQQSGLLAPAGLYQDPERLNQQLGIYIPPNAWDALKNTIDVNSGNSGNGVNTLNTNEQGQSKTSSLVDSVRSLQPTEPYYLENGGTNCMGTMGKVLKGTPFENVTWVPTAMKIAEENKMWHPSGDGYQPKAGDLAVVNGDNHIVMVNENGGFIHNSETGKNGKGGIIEVNESPEKHYGKVTGYISTSQYGTMGQNEPQGSGEGNTWYKKSDGVDMSNLQPQTKAGLETAANIFNKMSGGEKLMVTSGRDSDVHAQGQYSHYNGYKLDVSSPFGSQRLEDPQERAAFINALENVGIKVIDEWGKDKHLDLDFSGFKGGVNGVSQPVVNTQQRPSFRSVFNPQVVSGGGAILNPMVLYKAAVEQAERQRNQYNADREFNQRVYESNRNFEFKKQNAAAKQKQEDLSKYQLYSYDELYKEGSPISTLNNLIASPLKEDATDEQKQQYQTNMLNAVNSFAQYNVQKYKDLISKGYSEQDAQTILRNGIANAVGRSFMASQGGNSDSKKYMIEKAVSDIYYRTMGLVAQDKEALSKPSSTGSFKMLNDANYSSDKLNDIGEKSKQNVDDKELRHMTKKAKLENKLKELIKQDKYKGLYLEREGENLKIKMGRGITRNEAEPLARELRNLAEEYAKTITSDDIVKYKNEVEEMKRRNKQYQEMVNSQYLSDAEAHQNFNNSDDELVNNYLKHAENSYSW